MSGLEINKIMAAVLLAALIAMIVGTVSNILYRPKLEPEKRGFEVAVTEDEGSKEEAVVELSISELMAAANVENGKKIAKKCISCHSFEQGGPNKIGPNIWNIVNSGKGKKAGFVYSKAMASSEGNWDTESLFAFLKKPSKYMPGTKMSFAGVRKPQDVADVIAYLEENGS